MPSNRCGPQIQKPQMHGLGAKHMKFAGIRIGVLTTLTGCAVYFLRNEPIKARYREFYKNYDIEKEFDRMREKNLFDSC